MYMLDSDQELSYNFVFITTKDTEVDMEDDSTPLQVVYICMHVRAIYTVLGKQPT